jgi:CubicO group peptidase (beta-lactamase class C family)
MRKRLLSQVLCLAAAALGACGGPGRSGTPAEVAKALPSVPLPPAVNVAWLDSLARSYVAQKHLVGLSVGVAQDGKIVFARGYGFASLADHSPVTPWTKFAMGSVTKQFTCAAVLLLQESGRISMHDPVSKFFPNLMRAREVTLLDLGNHVSGYRDYYPLDFVDREMELPTMADSVIAEYATRPLDFEPGTRWSYSNTNFLILGRVVEKVSGVPFGTFLAQHIFAPTGMRLTMYDPSPGGPGMAVGYTSFALGAPEFVAPEGAGWAGMAGALWSTPSDLLTWDLALVDGKVLSPDSYGTLTTPRRLADGRSTGYGCGDAVSERGEAVVLTHGGAVSGFTAQNTVVPATRSAVVLMSNEDFGSLGELNRAILAKLLPHVNVPAIRGAPALPTAAAFIAQLQGGRVDRTQLGDDYSAYLTAERLAGARRTLAGRLSEVQVVGTAERGGMEVAELRFKVGAHAAAALMYRTPDGKIQEFLVYQP